MKTNNFSICTNLNLYCNRINTIILVKKKVTTKPSIYLKKELLIIPSSHYYKLKGLENKSEKYSLEKRRIYPWERNHESSLIRWVIL